MAALVVTVKAYGTWSRLPFLILYSCMCTAEPVHPIGSADEPMSTCVAAHTVDCSLYVVLCDCKYDSRFITSLPPSSKYPPHHHPSASEASFCASEAEGRLVEVLRGGTLPSRSPERSSYGAMDSHEGGWNVCVGSGVGLRLARPGNERHRRDASGWRRIHTCSWRRASSA